MKKNPENDINIIKEELSSLTENITNYFAGQLQDYTSLINYMEQMSSEFKTVFIRILICYLYFSLSWVYSGLPEATQ